MDTNVEIEWNDGTRAAWSLSDEDADRISAWIEANIKPADTVAC